jgi:NAD(P)-dependent dehydrogenase (short-subunit alcohol dehydrogenase family)
MVNARLEGFVRAAALEMPRSLRINAVSPPWVKETMVKLGMDPTSGLASADVAKAYVAAIEGSHQGVILDPHHVRGANLPGRRIQVSKTLGKVDPHTIAEPTCGIGRADFGPALRRNGSDAELGKMDEIGQNE